MTNAINCTSVKKVAEQQVVASDSVNINELSWGNKSSKAVETVAESFVHLDARWDRRGLDMSFNLMAEKQGSVREEHSVGRIWVHNYPSKVRFRHGNTTNPIKMQPAEAYAGFKNGIADGNALKSLAAITQTLGTPADRAYLADEARASIGMLCQTGFEPTRFLMRLAAIWAGAAALERTGSNLRLANAADDLKPGSIRTISEWGQACSAAAKGVEQPVLLNLRGAQESALFSRIVRTVCLAHPTFVTDRGHEPPSVMKFWPEIPNARAYIMQYQDQITALDGIITSRDAAILLSYFGRAWGMEKEVLEVCSFIAAQALRPSGSALCGKAEAAVFTVPNSRMGPSVLLPIVQAVGTLEDEEIYDELWNPLEFLTRGVGTAGVFLSCLNCVCATDEFSPIGIDPYYKDQRARHHSQRLRPRPDGTTASVEAAALAMQVGDNLLIPKLWAGLSPETNVKLWKHYPIECEECLPWLKAMPHNASILGMLYPANLKQLEPTNVNLSISSIEGRKGINDAMYSFHTLAPDVEFGYACYTAGTYTSHCKFSPLKSYRGVLSDGQFNRHRLDMYSMEPTVKFKTAKGVLAAHKGKERRMSWEWFYEWNTPFEELNTIQQYINTADVPADVPDLVPAVEMTEVPLPPSRKMETTGKTAYKPTAEQIAEWRDMLGDIVGNIVQPLDVMQAAAGKQLQVITYQQEAEKLSGAISAINMDTVEAIYGPMPEFAHWVATVAKDAACWDNRQSMKDTLTSIAALYEASALRQPETEPDILPEETPEVLAGTDEDTRQQLEKARQDIDRELAAFVPETEAEQTSFGEAQPGVVPATQPSKTTEQPSEAKESADDGPPKSTGVSGTIGEDR